VTNSEPDRGQLSSLLAGLAVAEQDFAATAIMVLPVDVPLITTEGVRAVVDGARKSPMPIVRAASGDRHGHPVIFRREVFDELRAADPAIGARAVVHADPARVADVQVPDPGALADVDTPEDYRRAFGRSV
jgi:CTP:molybdopterin cytidylyltransferase MocA